ncbi:hypothetical protein LTR16_005874, partial [Cryomyces antarcticus]
LTTNRAPPSPSPPPSRPPRPHHPRRRPLRLHARRQQSPRSLQRHLHRPDTGLPNLRLHKQQQHLFRGMRSRPASHRRAARARLQLRRRQGSGRQSGVALPRGQGRAGAVRERGRVDDDHAAPEHQHQHQYSAYTPYHGDHGDAEHRQRHAGAVERGGHEQRTAVRHVEPAFSQLCGFHFQHSLGRVDVCRFDNADVYGYSDGRAHCVSYYSIGIGHYPQQRRRYVNAHERSGPDNGQDGDECEHECRAAFYIDIARWRRRQSLRQCREFLGCFDPLPLCGPERAGCGWSMLHSVL